MSRGQPANLPAATVVYTIKHIRHSRQAGERRRKKAEGRQEASCPLGCRFPAPGGVEALILWVTEPIKERTPMQPYHRSRPVPPSASCRSGLGSREVSPEKSNLLRDEKARLCALNPWEEIRRHDVSADAAVNIVGVSLRILFHRQKFHGEGRLRPNSRRAPRLRRPAWSHDLKQAIIDLRSAPM